MEKTLVIKDIGGYLSCKSSFGEYKHCSFDNISFEFDRGANIIKCDIDGGGWQICYLLGCSDEEFAGFIPNKSADSITYDGVPVDFAELRNRSYYLDGLFEDDTSTVREIITHNLKKHKGQSTETPESIRELFGLTKDRFDRPLHSGGNEHLLQLAAIGHSMGKTIFCFPWLSARMTKYYTGYIEHIFDVLTELGAIVILPTSLDYDWERKYNIIGM